MTTYADMSDVQINREVATRLAAYIEGDSRPEPRLRSEAWLMYMDAIGEGA